MRSPDEWTSLIMTDLRSGKITNTIDYIKQVVKLIQEDAQGKKQ